MKIPDKYKGIVYIILSALSFAFMNAFVRLSGDLPAFQKSFSRNFIAFFFALIVTAIINALVPYISDRFVISTLNEGTTLYNFLRSISPMILPWL